MLTKSFTLLFYLKKRSNYVTGKLPIYMRLTVNGERIELTSKRECEPEKWNSMSGRKSGTKEETRILNSYLDTLQLKVYEVHRQLIESGAEITAETVKNHLTGNTGKVKMLLEIFKDHNEQLAQLIGTDFVPGTLKRYETSFSHTQDFIKWKYDSPDLPIGKLDFEFISDYAFWIKTIRHCNHNTTMKYLVNLKKVVLICVKKGWLTRDPFFAFKIQKHEVNRQALTAQELELISQKDFGQGRLDQVRDIFLFCCYTGLSYVDVQKLKVKDLIEGVDAGKWIMINRQKTDSPSRIPILPTAMNIIEKYENHSQRVSGDRILPVLSNQKMNAYLKEIADLCGIVKNVTFHLARHTFATTVTLTNGVPIESVSKMLGHRNIKTTQLYAKIVDLKISDDMKKLKEVLAKSSVSN